MKRGIFITFEGGEGSGKSTQARLLADRLRRSGRAVVHTREPGGTSIAESVRRVLLNPSSRVAPLTELMLYEAARAQHLAEVVTPALAAGKIVICERYTDATEAYQGFGRRLDLKKIRVLNEIATDGLRPDRTFLLDVPVGKGLSAARGLAKRLSAGTARAAAGGDRIERESAAFHDRVRQGYLALARRDKKRISVIAWGLSIDDVHGRILQELAPLLNSNNSSGPSPYPLPRGEGKSLFSFPSWGDRRRAPVTWGGRAADSKVPRRGG